MLKPALVPALGVVLLISASTHVLSAGSTSAAPPFRIDPITTPDADTAVKVDETALRYFASRNDVARAAVEIERLRRIYPGWVPPSDLFAPQASNEQVAGLWAMLAEGHVDDVRLGIEEITASFPGWKPPVDLIKAVTRLEVRNAVISASDAKNWQGVLDALEPDPDILVCNEMDVVWRVAEALVKVDRVDRAAAAYRYLLTRCDAATPEEKIGTVRKAATDLPLKDVRQIVTLARKSFDNKKILDEVINDKLRGLIGEAIAAKTEVASAEDLAAFVKTVNSAKDMQLLGWYYATLGKEPEAQIWFEKSIAADAKDMKAVEGLALVLRDQGEREKAEELAFSHSAEEPLLAKIVIELVSEDLTASPRRPVSPQRFERFLPLVTKTQSALGAQALGWRSLDDNKARDAREWFERSKAWGVSEPAVLGFIVSSQRLGDRKAAKAAFEAHKAAYPAIAALEESINAAAPRQVARRGSGVSSRAASRAVQLFEEGRYRDVVQIFEENPSLRRDSGLRLLKGWAQYHSRDWDGAEATFRAIDEDKPNAKARAALRTLQSQRLPSFFQ